MSSLTRPSTARAIALLGDRKPLPAPGVWECSPKVEVRCILSRNFGLKAAKSVGAALHSLTNAFSVHALSLSDRSLSLWPVRCNEKFANKMLAALNGK